MTSVLLEVLNLNKKKTKLPEVKAKEEEYKRLAKPDFELINKRKKETDFSDEEKALLRLMIDECKFHQLLVDETTKVFIDQPLPPVGYAGIYHGLTPFDPRPFESLFYGCSILWINKQGNHDDKQKWTSAINAILPDKSPLVPTIADKNSLNGWWYPSLGKGGWVSLCMSFSVSTGHQKYALVVVSGMDEKVHDEFMTLLNRLYKFGAALDDVYHAIQWYRSYVLENRKRILYLICNHGIEGISPKNLSLSVCNTSPHSLKEPEPVPVESIETLKRLGVQQPETLPISLPLALLPVSPHKKPLDEVGPTQGGLSRKQLVESQTKEQEIHEDYIEAEAEEYIPIEKETSTQPIYCETLDRHPKGYNPDLDIMLDDLIPYKHDKSHFLRLSNCCEMNSKVVRIEGPTYVMNLAEVDKDTDTRDHLHAYPALAIPNREMKANSGIMATSLNGRHGELNCHGRFSEEFINRSYGTKPVETLIPEFVRYSEIPLYNEN